jgi:hypothetical protein
MWKVMNACVMLHNMIIESERTDLVLESEGRNNISDRFLLKSMIKRFQHRGMPFFLAICQEILDPHVHQQLQNDLVDRAPMEDKGNT